MSHPRQPLPVSCEWQALRSTVKFIATDDVHVVLDYFRMSLIMWMKHGWKCRPRVGHRIKAFGGLEAMTFGLATADKKAERQPRQQRVRDVPATSAAKSAICPTLGRNSPGTLKPSSCVRNHRRRTFVR